jgi:hypothetical protein
VGNERLSALPQQSRLLYRGYLLEESLADFGHGGRPCRSTTAPIGASVTATWLC